MDISQEQLEAHLDTLGDAEFEEAINKLENGEDITIPEVEEEEDEESTTAKVEEEDDNTSGDVSTDDETDPTGDAAPENAEANTDADSNANANTDGSEDTDKKDGKEEDPDKVKEEVVAEELEKEAKKDSGESEAIKLEDVLSPLTYKGTTVPIDSLEDLRMLASKGIDYQSKSQKLAQDRRFVTTLKEKGLLDPDKLSYLISLHEGDKGAIAKFYKDNRETFDEFDTQEVEELPAYQNTNVVVDEKIQAIRDTLATVENEPYFNDLVTAINDEWDPASQQKLVETPHLLDFVIDHMKDDTYQTVAKRVSLGRLLQRIPATTPFLEAYIQCGIQYEQELAEAQSGKPSASTASATQARQQRSPATGGSNRGQPNNVMAPTKPSASRDVANLSIADLDKMDDETFQKTFENFGM